jgi:hypothetical protein
MSLEEQEYYQQRAETQIELAQQASDERAVQAHYAIASAYLDRAHGDDPKPPPGPLDLRPPVRP